MFFKQILLLTALITVLLSGSAVINAMSVDNVLFKGLLIDENSKKPIGAEVKFEDSEGDVIKVSADPVTGAFEQLLKANETYSITFYSPEILRKEVKITTKETKTYGEQKETFSVIKMVPGAKVLTLNISDDGKDLSKNGIISINELKMLLRFNRSLYIDMVVKNKELFAALEKLTSDKSWRMYRTKIELASASDYDGKKVDFPDNTDLVIIINKVEDPFK